MIKCTALDYARFDLGLALTQIKGGNIQNNIEFIEKKIRSAIDMIDTHCNALMLSHTNDFLDAEMAEHDRVQAQTLRILLDQRKRAVEYLEGDMRDAAEEVIEALDELIDKKLQTLAG